MTKNYTINININTYLGNIQGEEKMWPGENDTETHSHFPVPIVVFEYQYQ